MTSPQPLLLPLPHDVVQALRSLFPTLIHYRLGGQAEAVGLMGPQYELYTRFGTVRSRPELLSQMMGTAAHCAMKTFAGDRLPTCRVVLNRYDGHVVALDIIVAAGNGDMINRGEELMKVNAMAVYADDVAGDPACVTREMLVRRGM